MIAKRFVEILAIGTGFNGVLLTIQGLANMGSVLGAISVIASFTAFFIGFRKRHFPKRWRSNDF